MNNISGFSNSSCQMGALENLEKLRQPAKYPALDKMRLLTFIPEPYALSEMTKEKMNHLQVVSGYDVMSPSVNIPKQAKQVVNQLFKINNLLNFVWNTENQQHLRKYPEVLSEPNTQMAMKMNGRAIDDVTKGKAVPFFAGYFDAIKKPEQKVEVKLEEKPAPKSKYVSISERLAKKAAKRSMVKNPSKASRETIKLFKKQNKNKITMDEYLAYIETLKTPEKTGIIKTFGKAVKSVISKVAAIIIKKR